MKKMLLCSLNLFFWVIPCRELQVEGAKGKGRGKKIWNKCVKVDKKSLGLVRNDAQNEDKWRESG